MITTQSLNEVAVLIGRRFVSIAFGIVVTIVANAGGMNAAYSADDPYAKVSDDTSDVSSDDLSDNARYDRIDDRSDETQEDRSDASIVDTSDDHRDAPGNEQSDDHGDETSDDPVGDLRDDSSDDSSDDLVGDPRDETQDLSCDVPSDDTQNSDSEISNLNLNPKHSNTQARSAEFSEGVEDGNGEQRDGGKPDAVINNLQKLKQIIQDEASKDEVPIDEYDREHWAYQPIEQPPIPNFGDDVDPAIANWPSNAIDAFLLRKMLDAGLQPAPATDRVTLIRRLSFDLTGLPPSLEEVDRFVADTRPKAYERLVDRMLSTPEYGQKWAQYWLDLARFAETDGYEHDKIRETAWQYRDWVIQALNDDMPYDRFVSLQIAGDLIAPDDPSAKIATAFCLSGPDMPDINSQEERRHVLLNEITSTVGAVFLSLQMGCAQCHDHKYDAISQADFYRLRAFFEPAIELKANQSVTTLGSFPVKESARMYHRGDWRSPAVAVKAAFPRIANLSETTVKTSQSLNPKEDANRPLLGKQAGGAGIPFDPNLLGSSNDPSLYSKSNRAASGSAKKDDSDLDKVDQAVDLQKNTSSLQSTSERPVWNQLEPRMQLAAWLTDRNNPLVARSIVNRVWQFHFFKGLSQTPSDFGLVGVEPTHPELLDFLASQLISGQWSLKRLHREILLSSFYQMTSRSIGDEDSQTAWERSLEIDPRNQLWSRFPRRRLDAESIRDAMLFVSGLLNPITGGSGVQPPLPSELVKTLKSGQWKVSEEKSDHYRRSIYIFARRNLTYPLFATFDRPAANCTCAERVPSTTPLQSLSLLNSEFTTQVINGILNLVAELSQEKEDESLKQSLCVPDLYRQILQRQPNKETREATEKFLSIGFPAEDHDVGGTTGEQLWVDLCVALINSNGFLYID